MITEDLFLIVPANMENLVKGFRDKNLVLNPIKLNDGRIAINARAREQLGDKFPLRESVLNKAKVEFELRKLNYAEVWHDPDLPNMI
jgi:hypothetical protein